MYKSDIYIQWFLNLTSFRKISNLNLSVCKNLNYNCFIKNKHLMRKSLNFICFNQKLEPTK